MFIVVHGLAKSTSNVTATPLQIIGLCSKFHAHCLPALPDMLTSCLLWMLTRLMVPCCAAAAAYSGDGVLHTLPGAAVAGAAPPQLCQLPVCLAGPYAHAGPAPALPCPALPCSCCCHRHDCNVVLSPANWDFAPLHWDCHDQLVLRCCPAPACCSILHRAAVVQAVAMLYGLLEIINLSTWPSKPGKPCCLKQQRW